jgi:hypothetical protein
MENQDKIKQLEKQLDSVLSAYNILEEYCCLLVGGDLEENETISEANKIVNEAFNPLVINYRNNQNK